MFKEEIKGKIDSISSIAGLILGFLIVSLYLISPTIHLFSIGFFLILACLFYILIFRNITYVSDNFQILKEEKLILEISFFLLFSASILVLQTSLMRPLIYFISISACAGLLAVSIYGIDSEVEKKIQIIKIFLLSFSLKYSIYNLSGIIPGIDSITHAKANSMLSNAGNIEILPGKESYFPIMHIQTSITQILTEASIKDATNFAVIIPFVISTIFIYLAFREFFDDKLGLLAMLVVNITNFHIYWGSAPQTTTYGLMIYYFLMFLLIKTYMKSNVKLIAITLIVIFTLIITHAVSSFIFLMTILGLFFGFSIYKLLMEKAEKIYYTNVILITFVALLQHWFIAIYSKDSRSFFDTIVYTLNFYIIEHADFLNRPEAVNIADTIKLAPFTERFADTLGFSILLFFAIIGCLMWLSPKYIDKLKFSFITCITILLGITFAFPLFGIRNIIPTRWFAFEYVFLSVMAVFSIVHINLLLNKQTNKKIFLAFTFFILTFFMSTNTISNVDSPIWLKNSTVSTTYSVAEIKGAETLSNKYSSNLFSDSNYGDSVIDVYLDINTNSLRDREQVFDREGEIFIWRNYMLTRPITTSMQLEGYNRRVKYPDILGSESFNELDNMYRIYDNSEIIGFYIREI